jgi:galactokinase
MNILLAAIRFLLLVVALVSGFATSPQSPSRRSFTVTSHLLKHSTFTFKLSVATMPSPSLNKLVDQAKGLFDQLLSTDGEAVIAVAPGRVNLIGEHTDYTGGFVLPFAIDYSTAVYGTGSLETGDGKSASLRFISTKSPDTVEEFTINTESVPPAKTSWTSYVLGTVYQYLPDLPPSTRVNLSFAISGNVPLGSGLSSSASLEVSIARFLEAVLNKHAFSSETNPIAPKVRALRCQKAENQWCQSPCGIMDQYVSSAASEGCLLLIDCHSLEYKLVQMADTDSRPVLVVANSNVQHDIAGGEYPVRVAQCQTATQALAKINSKIVKLRDATLDDVQASKELMDPVSYQRAKHVVTENDRTLQAKEALEQGDWARVGELMNASHASMRDDYEVSCEEIDVLVELAQNYNGVYGSRLTGGGFGGCTVTLVAREHAEGLMAHLVKEYKTKTGKDCFCFETIPATGARLISLDEL